LQVGKPFAIELAMDLSAVPRGAHDAGTPQPPQMPRHQRLANANRSRQRADREITLGSQQVDDTQASRIAERSVIELQIAQRTICEQRTTPRFDSCTSFYMS